MTSLAEALTRAISSVPNPSEAQAEILARLSALRSRFDEGLLRVAVLGQFKRGKSTLLNALLGAPLLPTGVTPVTALATFISAGDSTRLRIAFRGGKEPIVTDVAPEIPAVLERYVSESRNPHNRLGVESVAVEVRSDFLDEGIVLIDTPGVGSTFLHNTRAAEAVLAECDAALRERRARDHLVAEAEKAALRNVANLDWAVRQNIEDTFRRFESSLSEQLDQALQATRQALQLAQRRRAARSEAVEADVEQADRSVAELSAIVTELEANEPEPRAPTPMRERAHVETVPRPGAPRQSTLSP
jgi:hypothetical protein